MTEFDARSSAAVGRSSSASGTNVVVPHVSRRSAGLLSLASAARSRAVSVRLPADASDNMMISESGPVGIATANEGAERLSIPSQTMPVRNRNASVKVIAARPHGAEGLVDPGLRLEDDAGGDINTVGTGLTVET